MHDPGVRVRQPSDHLGRQSIVTTLSILMPVFNERATLPAAVKAVLDVDYPCSIELVIVDDGSTDGSADMLDQFDDPRIVVRRHPHNRGKGAAIRTAADAASGDYCIMCDADEEYSPRDIPKLMRPVLEGSAEVVYGTRIFTSHTAFSFWYVIGNKVVTQAANVLFDTWISDLETCFKLMPLALYRELDIRETGFGMEAEVTAKLLKRGVRPYEVPIDYQARGRDEGKKLTWRDGVSALRILARIRVRRVAQS
jgi:glycosyltransferase involved in cell wall biosynthesis